MNISDEIKATVNLKQYLTEHGVAIKRGMCKCFVHNDNNASMKIYDNNTYHCFTCGADGSVIDFCMSYYGLSFMDACRKLDADYGLNLFVENPTKEQLEQARQAKLRRERERAEKEQIQALVAYQKRKLLSCRCWFWQQTFDDNFPAIVILDGILDRDRFPLRYDVDAMVRCLWVRWKGEVRK